MSPVIQAVRRFLCSSRTLLLLVLLLHSCSIPSRGKSTQFFALDTPCSITLRGYVPDSLFFAAEQEVQRIEELMSSYRPESEISILNRLGDNILSAETFGLLQQALEFAEQSMGLFDPTVGPLSQLWDVTGSRALQRYEEQLKKDGRLANSESLGGDISGNRMQFQIDTAFAHEFRSQRKPPALADIRKALRVVSYRNVELEASTRRVHFLKSGVELDLGGIAKGFAADQVADILQEANAPPGVIDLGGNILLHGRKENGDPWSIGVRGEGDSYLMRMFIFQPQAIVTSGIYQRYYIYQGKRYHHILSTQSGYPIDNGMFSVTVITDSSAKADALATALFIYGREKGMAEVQHRQNAGENIEAFFVGEDFQVSVSSGISLLSKEQDASLRDGSMQIGELSETQIWLFPLQESLKIKNE